MSRLRVVRASPQLLRLAYRPLVLGLVLVIAITVLGLLAFAARNSSMGAIFGGVAGMQLLALVLFVRWEQVTFDRAAGSVRIESRAVSGRKVQVVELSRIRAAEVERQRGADRHEAFRPVLRLRSGDSIALTATFRRTPSLVHETAAAVNDWLREA